MVNYIQFPKNTKYPSNPLLSWQSSVLIKHLRGKLNTSHFRIK